MNEIEKLAAALDEAAKYFDSRGFSTWAAEARESIVRLNNGDVETINYLCLKYAPTCQVEELFITEYEQKNEPKVVELNESLAKVINFTYAALERAQSVYT